MKTYCMLLATVLLLGWFSVAVSEQSMKHSGGTSKMIPLLHNAGIAEREDMVVALTKERFALQAELIKQLDAPKSKHHQISVVYLLGLYRMERAVRDLAKVITLEAEVRIQSKEWLWDQFPVVEALVKIGRPSIPAMLESITAAKGEKAMQLSVKVIRHVETPAIAKLILEEAIAKEKDPTKMKSLREALEYLKSEYHLEERKD